MTFQQAKHTDLTVARMLRAGQSLEEIIGVLAEEKALLLKDIVGLEMIAPKKVTIGKQVFVYRAPAEIVPEV